MKGNWAALFIGIFIVMIFVTSQESAAQIEMPAGFHNPTFVGQVNVTSLPDADVLSLLDADVLTSLSQPSVKPFLVLDPESYDAIKNGSKSVESTEVLPTIVPATLSSTSESGFFAESTGLNILSSFDGLTQSESGFFTPPNVLIATGPNDIVEMVNVQMEVFQKENPSSSFAKPLAGSLGFFKTSDTAQLTDPKILFDSISDRWFATIADKTTNSVYIAVSVTNDPMGIWNIYNIPHGTLFPDQPRIGVSNDKFVVSTNDFSSTGFVQVHLSVLDKSQLVSGAPSISAVTFTGSSDFSIKPVQSLSSTSRLYMVESRENFIFADTIRLFALAGSVDVIAICANVTP